MRTGISTACLYPMYTEQALAKLLNAGFSLFEIFFNSFSELDKTFLSTLRHMLLEQNAQVKSIHPFTSGSESYLLFSNYQRRFEDTCKFYDRYFETAAYLGAEIVVLHGDRNPLKGGLTEEDYFERYAVLAERGRRAGVTLAQENVNLFRSQDPAFIRRMSAYLGDQVRYVLDVKQAVRAGFDPFAMLEAMGENLVHVHINDNTKEEDCLLPGAGRMDFNRLIESLRGFKYDGDLIIEVYSKNFACFEELIKARQTVEQLIK